MRCSFFSGLKVEIHDQSYLVDRISMQNSFRASELRSDPCCSFDCFIPVLNHLIAKKCPPGNQLPQVPKFHISDYSNSIGRQYRRPQALSFSFDPRLKSSFRRHPVSLHRLTGVCSSYNISSSLLLLSTAFIPLDPLIHSPLILRPVASSPAVSNPSLSLRFEAPRGKHQRGSLREDGIRTAW